MKANVIMYNKLFVQGGTIFQYDEYIIKSNWFKFHCTLSHLLNSYPQQTPHKMQEKKEKGNLQNKTCGNISTYLNWDIVAVSNSKGVKLLHSLEAKDFMHHTLVSFGFLERHVGQNISWCFWLNIVVSNS